LKILIVEVLGRLKTKINFAAIKIMTNTKKIALSIGIAGGALLAFWLLTGDRKKKTKAFVSRTAADLKKAFSKDASTNQDAETHYV